MTKIVPCLQHVVSKGYKTTCCGDVVIIWHDGIHEHPLYLIKYLIEERGQQEFVVITAVR